MKYKLRSIISAVIPGRQLRYLHLIRKPRAIRLKALQLVYVPIPKVANRSIKTSLAKKTNLSFNISAHDADWDSIATSDLPMPPFFAFSFVRNPLDRLVSCYTQKFKLRNVKQLFWKYGNDIQKDMTFNQFANFVIKTPDYLSDNHFKSQHVFLCHKDKIVVDFIGKFERLEEDWNQIAMKASLPQLDHLNPSPRAKTQTYYSKELAIRVAERYAKDIELFGYQDSVNRLIDSL